jgi:endonuclease III-like uncharacterized protein
LLDSLCKKYGTHICEVGEHTFHAFPSLKRLSEIKEEELRDIGFGYRARYIITSANQIIEKGEEKWLESLRANNDRKAVQTELLSLMGIGKKVADCISLFSLDKLECIPVDTHVWQIAQHYLPKLKGKKLSDPLYEEIGLFFQEKFKPYCGWAHSVLFASDLSFFKKEILLQETANGSELLIVKEETLAAEIALPSTRKRTPKAKRKQKEESSDEEVEQQEESSSEEEYNSNGSDDDYVHTTKNNKRTRSTTRRRTKG